MSTVSLLLPLDNEFWQALAEQDYESADELLRASLVGHSYQSSGEVYYEGNLLEAHLPKYLTVDRATFMEHSTKIKEIEFAEDGKSATIHACYQSDLWLGCRDMGGISDEHEDLRVTFEPKGCKAYLHVLEYPAPHSYE